MSNTKKKISLVAKEIKFTDFGIQYIVDFKDFTIENTYILPFDNLDISGITFCSPDIKNKDLILQPSLVDKDNNEVFFSVCNVTPHYYQDILDRTIRNFEEYKNDLNKIYQVGEVVAYILF